MTIDSLFLILKIVTIAFVVYWVFMDAKSRDYHPWIWAATAVIIGLVGIDIAGPIMLMLYMLFYLWRRPKGPLRLCPSCRKPALATLAQCPRCKGILKKDCYRCFAAVDVTNDRCPNCKAKL